MRSYSILLESSKGLKSIDISSVTDQEMAVKLARKRYPFEEWRMVQLTEKR